ncbi:MAG: dihydrodipicolinate synthase family protein [Thermotogae bacterium]|nr:dihydrodipicolinate synthase family protein [Thermotogota bacterium]
MNPGELKEKIRGVIVVMTTPFKSNFELDEEGLRKQTRFLIESGIRNGSGVLVPTGSTGECPGLTDEERKTIVRIVKEEAKNEVPVIAGCNHTDTRTVIKLAHYSEEVGADGLMISPPYYWKPSDEMVISHYEAIAKETDLGIIVYNNWFATQYDIPIDVMVKLAEIPNVIALKDCTPGLIKLSKMITTLEDKIVVANGTGECQEPYAAMMGSKGFVTGEANFMPRTLVEMYKAEENGDYTRAKEIYRGIAPLIDCILGGKSGADYIGRIKAIMDMLGIPAGPPRLPLLPPDEETKKELKKLFKEARLFDEFELE